MAPHKSSSYYYYYYLMMLVTVEWLIPAECGGRRCSVSAAGTGSLCCPLYSMLLSHGSSVAAVIRLSSDEHDDTTTCCHDQRPPIHARHRVPTLVAGTCTVLTVLYLARHRFDARSNGLPGAK